MDSDVHRRPHLALLPYQMREVDVDRDKPHDLLSVRQGMTDPAQDIECAVAVREGTELGDNRLLLCRAEDDATISRRGANLLAEIGNETLPIRERECFREGLFAPDIPFVVYP